MMGENGSSSCSSTANYLRDLRQDRPQRPNGSRPAPVSSRSERRAEVITPPETNGNVIGNVNSNGMSRAASRSPFAGRPLAREPTPSIREEPQEMDEVSAKSIRRRSSYMENGMRWMEKQEARSLRMALEDMDLEEERKIHAAARDEAAELVWKHRFPEAAAKASFVNPGLKDYSKHLRKGSYQRSHSSGESGGSRSVSSSSGSNDEAQSTRKTSSTQHRKVSPPSGIVSMPKRKTSKSYAPLAEAVAKDIAVAHRRSSSGSVRILSGEKKMFMHPNDKIWEDPTEEADALPPPPAVREPVRVQHARPVDLPPTPVLPPTTSPSIRKNPFARVRAQYDSSKLERANSAPVLQTLPHAPTPVLRPGAVDAPILRPSGANPPTLRHDRVEIQRNPPSQSRNPWYVSNEPLPPTPPRQQSGREEDEVAPKSATPTRRQSQDSRRQIQDDRRRSEDDDVDVEQVRMKDGKEVRGDDIRAATGKKRKDYSPNLPRPTLVSDKPGRPIVSFERRKEIVLEEQKSAARELPTVPANPPPPMHSIPSINILDERPSVPMINLPDDGPPAIPTINLPDDDQPSIPTINLPDDGSPPIPTIKFPDDDQTSIPTINFPDDNNLPSINVEQTPSQSRSATNSRIPHRPLPTPTRPLPHHAATTGGSGSPSLRSTPHYTPSLRQIPTGALCTHCALPIAGRILSAAGKRFHPGCFVCFTCGTNLECVAFYPEPEICKQERADDSSGLEDVRFFCHLDFHEHFSPRCKSCKTPIESGEVISACGSTFHPGHFFCAECGDPFDASKPFVEKEGYAWCVGCFERRTAVKCRGCRKGIMDVVVKAAGGEWHEECFKCHECGGGFGGEGRYFLRDGEEGDVVVCVGCEERRLKG